MTRLRSATSFLSVLVGVGLAYWAIYGPWQTQQTALGDKIRQLQSDIATLDARIASLTPSQSEQAFPAILLWRSDTKAEAELALQDLVVDMAGQFGITLITFGASTLTRETAQDMIAFEIEAEAPLGQTHAFLAALETLDPKAAIGVLRMRPAHTYETVPVADVMMYSQITLWSFWEGTS